VAYIDVVNDWTDNGILKGLGIPGYADSQPSDYNYVMLAFWFCDGNKALDMALYWQKFSEHTNLTQSRFGLGSSTQAIQKVLKKKFNDAGIKILVSAFGATEWPTSAGLDATTCGKNLAQFVIDNNLDGADADWEDNAAMNAGTGEKWLIDFTKAYRSVSPDTILAHAPQGPYFSGTFYKNGGYGTVDKAVGDMIDFYFIQFYNQGLTSYDTYEELFTKTTKGAFPGTSIKEIASRGVPLQKLIVGKPIVHADATNTGWVDQGTLGAWGERAFNEFGWYAGMGHWQYKSGQDGKAIRDAITPLKNKCVSAGKCKA